MRLQPEICPRSLKEKIALSSSLNHFFTILEVGRPSSIWSGLVLFNYRNVFETVLYVLVFFQSCVYSGKFLLPIFCLPELVIRNGKTNVAEERKRGDKSIISPFTSIIYATYQSSQTDAVQCGCTIHSILC